MRALAAKLSGNSVTGASVGFCDGLAAREAADVKGLDVALLLEAELVEKGFAAYEAEDPGENNAVPMSVDCWFCFGSFSSSFPVFVTLPALTPLTLPSFRRHAFLQQPNMYNLRSWPGNRDGRSPLSWRSSVSRELQTLHFASAPDGATLSSSHV
jgi:hypothetical protein